MPITAQSIVTRMRQVGLDAQPNTDYFDTTIDLLPAIDSAVKWLVTVCNAAKAQNKSTEEALRELAKCYIYRTNAYSRIIFENSVWSIDAVAPLCATTPNSNPIPAQPTSPFQSWKRTDLSFVRSYYSAYRKTIEEVNQNRLNPMSPGYFPPDEDSSILIEGSQYNITFCYVPSYDYIYPTVAAGSYIEILPEIPQKLCAVFLTENPASVTSVNDIIKFPESLFNLVYEKALQFVSYSQGDQTSLYGVTDVDIARLVKYTT